MTGWPAFRNQSLLLVWILVLILVFFQRPQMPHMGMKTLCLRFFFSTWWWFCVRSFVSCEGASISHLKQPLIASAHTKLPTTQALRHSIWIWRISFFRSGLGIKTDFFEKWGKFSGTDVYCLKSRSVMTVSSVWGKKIVKKKYLERQITVTYKWRFRHLALNAVTKTKESLKCRIQDKPIILHVKLTKWDVFFSFQAQSRQTEIW